MPAWMMVLAVISASSSVQPWQSVLVRATSWYWHRLQAFRLVQPCPPGLFVKKALSSCFLSRNNAGPRRELRGYSLMIHAIRSPEPLGLDRTAASPFTCEELTVDISIGLQMFTSQFLWHNRPRNLTARYGKNNAISQKYLECCLALSATASMAL